MSGGANGNLRLAEWCYQYIKENGHKTVSEMKDYINEQKMVYPGDIHREKKGWASTTSQQLTNVIRCSPLFEVVGKTSIIYATGTDNAINLYGIVPIEKAVDTIAGKKHLIRKRWPQVMKDEMKRRGMI